MKVIPKALFTATRLLLVAVLIGNVVFADDWPQWRGPNRDADGRETGIVEAIPAAGLPVKWRTRILNGWSGPAVTAGRVFVTDHNY